MTISSGEQLSPVQSDEGRTRVAWHLGLEYDLSPFYAIADGEPCCPEHRSQLRRERQAGLLDVRRPDRRHPVPEHQVPACVRDARESGPAFGDSFVADGRVYHASPTPEALAAAPLEAIRAARVGYRDRYVKGVAEAVAGGVDLEALKDRPPDEAQSELLRLLGVGPYTAELALIRGAARGDGLLVDVYSRQALSQLYFGGGRAPDEQLREFARARWGPYQGYAAFLTTDTDAWATDLDVGLRLRSGALSDPDPVRSRSLSR